MRAKIFALFLPVLAAFPSFVKACGLHEEGNTLANNVVGFGFIGGIVSTLVIVAIVLSVTLLSKRRKK